MNKTINCRGLIIDLSSPKIMGILNLSNSSFYKESIFKNWDNIKKRIEEMISEGVDIIDLGGQSTKPYIESISSEEELKIILPILKKLTSNFPNQIFSVDTFYSNTAKICYNEGIHIINDISGGTIDKNMFDILAEIKIPYVCTHIVGTPKNMQENIIYEDIVLDILKFFDNQILKLTEYGIKDIIVDVGIGFSKNLNHNFELIKKLKIFECLKKPILIGVSRKSFIYKLLNINANEALNGSTVMNTLALLNGANILRVHDIKEAKQTINLLNNYNICI